MAASVRWIAVLLAQALAVAAPLKEVIVVHKTHFDIGFTDLAANVIERYRTTMIDNALKLVDQSHALPPEHRFVWTIPGWPMSQILWEGQTAERRERVMNALRSHQFVTHALPFSLHTEALELEDLVRGLGFSSRLARSIDADLPRDAKMTDVPSHSWVLPTLLKHAGVEFLHLGSNRMSSGPELPQFGTNGPETSRQSLFWWEGPDGSRLLTMYSRAYGSSLVPPSDWPYSTWLALIHTGDNAGPPSADAVRKILDDAKAQLPGVRIRFGRLSDFSDALLKENPRLPVIRADMPDPWIYGIMSMPAETALARTTRPRIAALEILNTLLSGWTGEPGAAPAVEAAYEQSLLYGEHTWGYNPNKLPRRYYGAEWEANRNGVLARLEPSWAEHGAYIERAAALTGPKLEANLRALAAAAGASGKRIAVFNPLPWARDGVVEIKIPRSAPASLRDAETGAAAPLEYESGAIRFVARNVPPLGYRTYVFSDKSAPPASGLVASEAALAIENESFRIKVDPAAGAISSIMDKRSSRELVDRDAGTGFAQYLHEQFSANEMNAYVKAYGKPERPGIINAFGKPGMPGPDDLPYRMVPASGYRARFARTPVSASVTMEGPRGAGLTLVVYAGQPWVEVRWRITGKQPTPLPEGGWLAFPFKLSKPEFRLARLGAIIDPAKETVRGSNHDVYCLNGGVAVLEAGGRGAGLCPLDSPLVSLDHPGLWQYTKEFKSSRPSVYVNLYNNVWGTNFAQWYGGSWTSRVRLWSIASYEPVASLLAPSEEARAPLEGAFADGPRGKLPPSRTGLRISRPGVLVTAFGKNPDGAGRILRLWEQAGAGGSIEVCLPSGTTAGTRAAGRPAGRAGGSARPRQWRRVFPRRNTAKCARDLPASVTARRKAPPPEVWTFPRRRAGRRKACPGFTSSLPAADSSARGTTKDRSLRPPTPGRPE